MTTSLRPFHGPDTVPAGRRLLLISYHFPPGTSTGALRWQKLSVHAARRGWGLDVITADPASLPNRDMSRLAELPGDLRIFAVPRSPSGLEQLLRPFDRLRRNSDYPRGDRPFARPKPASVQPVHLHESALPAFRPSPAHLRRALSAWRYLQQDSGWGSAALSVAMQVADPGVHQAVIACGPPHVAAMVAGQLSLRTGLPLVLDLRDPWGRASMVPAYCASPLFFELLRRREATAVRRAELVVVNTDAHRTALQAAHPRQADRIVCVLNGCDQESVPPLRPDVRFAIGYAGNIYLDRDPRPFFRAAARVVRERGLTPDRFGIELMGEVQQYAACSLDQLAHEAGLGDHVRVHSRRSRGEALEFLSGLPMLLSLPQGAHLSVPSKIYEYMQFEAWVLALASPGSATELVLRGTGVDVADPDDEAAIAALIASRYDQYAAGMRPRRLIEWNRRLTREYQAGRLFDELQKRVEGSRPRRAARPERRSFASFMRLWQGA